MACWCGRFEASYWQTVFFGCILTVVRVSVLVIYIYVIIYIFSLSAVFDTFYVFGLVC